MTEPDEALIWAREQVPEGWYEDEDDLEWRAKAYRAGQAASAERIKALEEEVARLKERATPPPSPTITPGSWRADHD